MDDLYLSYFETHDPDYHSSWPVTDEEIEYHAEAADFFYLNLACS